MIAHDKQILKGLGRSLRAAVPAEVAVELVFWSPPCKQFSDRESVDQERASRRETEPTQDHFSFGPALAHRVGGAI